MRRKRECCLRSDRIQFRLRQFERNDLVEIFFFSYEKMITWLGCGWCAGPALKSPVVMKLFMAHMKHEERNRSSIRAKFYSKQVIYSRRHTRIHRRGNREHKVKIVHVINAGYTSEFMNSYFSQTLKFPAIFTFLHSPVKYSSKITFSSVF